MEYISDKDKALYPFKATLGMLDSEYVDPNNKEYQKHMLSLVMEWYNTRKSALDYKELKAKEANGL